MKAVIATYVYIHVLPMLQRLRRKFCVLRVDHRLLEPAGRGRLDHQLNLAHPVQCGEQVDSLIHRLAN